MGTAALAMPSRVDLATWDADICRREDSYELVEGIPTMAPGGSYENRGVAALLVGLLNAHRDGWLAVTDGDVTVSEVPATVRRPDVVVGPTVAARAGARSAVRLAANEVLFVAEIVSPSSVERDLVAKRREYALAGIPSYLVVDLRDGRRELTLYAERSPDGLFVDVDPAERVTVSVGATMIDVRVDDLLP